MLCKIYVQINDDNTSEFKEEGFSDKNLDIKKHPVHGREQDANPKNQL